MKKRTILLSALLALAMLVGCHAAARKNGKDGFSYGEKAHRWRVLDAAGEEIALVSDEDAVKELDGLLLGEEEGWDRLSEASGEAAYTYIFSQEETLKAGQDPDKERTYEDLLRFTVSGTEDVVTMEVLSGVEKLEDLLTFALPVPPETAEALRNPEQFS